jgi:hypothetical protein
MLDRLKARADGLARDAVRQAVERLAALGAPDGVTIESNDRGIKLSGKQLRRRMIDNPLIRNFWR